MTSRDAIRSTAGVTSPSLIDRIKASDQTAWEKLFDLYGPLVNFWLRRAKLQPADARDVSQEVFQAVAKGIGKFKKEASKDTFRGWLHTITNRKVIDHYRKTKKQPLAAGGTTAHERFQGIAELDSGSVDAEEDKVMQRVRRRALELVRSEFEDRTWQMAVRAAAGEATKDVASEFGVSATAVRMAKSRVLSRLRQELGDLEP